MCFPYRAAIKRLQRLGSRGHVGKSTQPHEAVRIILVAKVSDDGDTDRFLGFDEFALEHLDETVELVRMQRVLAQLHEWTTARRIAAAVVCCAHINCASSRRQKPRRHDQSNRRGTRGCYRLR